jgi:putative FmdB family regulatory protein
MPLYEYLCEACDNRFEVIQKFSDPPVETCRVCGKGPVQRLPSSPAIQFKGSGWYITDYAKKAGGDSAPAKADAQGADGKGAGDAKGDTGTKSETATKTDKGGASTPAPATSSKD